MVYCGVTLFGLVMTSFDICDQNERLHTCGVILLWPVFLAVFLAKAFIVGVSDLVDYAVDAIKSIVSE